MTLPRSLDDLAGLRAARWIRESTAEQTDRYGPAAQREHQDRAIARHGLVDSGLVWQVAHSGRTIATTPAFVQMMAAAGVEFDVLLVGYVSRFARDLETAVTARRQLHAADAAILFCDDGILTSDVDQWERWAREAVEAEAYSHRLARRISEGYAAKFRGGDQGGSPGLGFMRTPAPDSRLVIDPAAMPRAVALFERYAIGSVSIAELAADDGGLGVEGVRAILANPLYNGWAVRHRQRPDESRSAAPWRSSPPVDDELWARVQAVRAERHRGGGGPARHVHLLAKRLWCACGRRLRADVAHQRRSAPIRRYRHDDRCMAWSTSTVPARRLEEVVDRQLRELRLDAAWLARLRLLAGQAVPAPQSGELRRRQLERELEGKARLLARRQLTTEAFVAESERIRAELDALETVPTSVRLVDPDAAIVALRTLRTAWRDADPDVRRRLVRAVFERVEVVDPAVPVALHQRLTPWARAHGLATALPVTVVLASPAGAGLWRATVTIEGRAEELAAARRVRSA
jgi:DNA invertase Pin-like site-specific DNA recombinase